MVRLIKKSEKPSVKTTIWCTERKESGERRKQFTIYGVSLDEIEALLMRDFKQK